MHSKKNTFPFLYTTAPLRIFGFCLPLSKRAVAKRGADMDPVSCLEKLV